MQGKQGRWDSAAARRIVEFAGNVSTVEDAVRVVASRFLRDLACPPTDLEVLKDRLKVKKIDPVPGLPIAGELRPDGDGFAVVYAASMSEGRKRFTIAHEFGHAVFEQTGPNCPRHGVELEKICDMLASEFLMPCEVFRTRLNPNIHPTEIFRLAREFGTSIAATSVRCRQLLGVSIFQLKDAEFEWGVGTIRRKSDLDVYRDVLRESIEIAMAGADGEGHVFLRRGNQRLQWTCLKGQRRALFLMQPCDRRVAAGSRAADT
jgi:Zn-dependent peptidase ImmA (M78 family)